MQRNLAEVSPMRPRVFCPLSSTQGYAPENTTPPFQKYRLYPIYSTEVFD